VVALRVYAAGAWESDIQRMAVGPLNAPAAAVLIGPDLPRNEGAGREDPGSAGSALDAPHSDAKEWAESPARVTRGTIADQAQAGLGIEPEDAPGAYLALVPDPEDAESSAVRSPGGEAGFDIGSGMGLGGGN
jgi:hypothetical protein